MILITYKRIAVAADATLLFETELVSIQKSGGASSIDFQALLQLLAVPAVIMYIIYYLYDKYKKEPTKKDLKEEKKSMRNSHRKKPN